MTGQEKRPFDIVVFGASGYTGTYVVEELILHGGNLKFAIAGRNREKLEDVVKNIVAAFPDLREERPDFENLDIIIADVAEKETIRNMCMKTKVLINCTGPYRFFGAEVVEECVKNSTHYLDVCGEPQFLEKIQLQYFTEAKENGIYIVGACGFDSIPCDLGIEILKSEFDGDINSVETYLHLDNKSGNTVNFGTWQSAIYGLAHASELKPIRNELKRTLFPNAGVKSMFPLKKRPVLFKKDDFWCIPFIGSDKSVAIRTQNYNLEFRDERPVQIETYMYISTFFYAVGVLLIGLIFKILVNFTYGQHLLESYPEIFSAGVFSKNPPKKEEHGSDSSSITFEAKGWSEDITKLDSVTDQYTSPPDKAAKAVFQFPDGPYTTTAVCVVSCALVLLTEPENMPENGGVFTPGAAFKETTLLQYLEKRGASFDLVEDNIRL